MAVDANILIFERMKEERRWGKDRKRALELGFARAWTSIWASNVSSMMTAAILYGFGTSLVRGFAVTLFIGVVVSMFTAIVVTRTFLRLVIK
jgi:preprotein translocase subunit SecD